MKTNKSSLNLTSLDFDLLKGSLIDFLKEQEQFRDYDFAGSNMNVLLDLLSHNTQKNLFYLNMNFAETWLDSAQLKDSVLSRAKELNYTPRSVRSAKARLKVSFKATGENQPYIIQKGSAFSTLIKNQSFTFSIPETITVASATDTYEFETDVYEGVYLKDSFIVKPNSLLERYRISNRNVDTTSINVVVFEDGSVVGKTYSLSKSLLDINDKSNVFFLQASENGFYEILFGDGNIGSTPKSGSLIVIDYRISAGPRANGASSFIIGFDPTDPYGELLSNATITVVSNAADGADAETIESIKYYAPRHFQVQERCVIPTDYEIALKNEFPEINACSAIGGEDREPAQFGKVFIAIDLKEIDGLPDTKVQVYKDFIRRRSALTPVFIQPVFTFFEVQTNVKYNINITTNSPNNMKTVIWDAISTYNDDFLNDFGLDFYYSDFVSMIDNVDDSIVSNMTRVNLYKKINPILNDFQDFTLSYGVPLRNDLTAKSERFSINERTAVTSSQVRYNGSGATIMDDSKGILALWKNDNGVWSRLLNIGTVDYDTGVIVINDLKVEDYSDDAIRIYVTARKDDMSLPKDTLAMIEPDQVKITVEQVRI